MPEAPDNNTGNVTVRDRTMEGATPDVPNIGTNAAQTTTAGGPGGTGPVTSINGKVGVVVLKTDDISDVGETNKFGPEFGDGSFRVHDVLDSTRKVALLTSGISTATTRELAVQDKSGTIALLDDIKVLPDWINAADYGIVGDGTTNNNSQMRRALLELQKMSGGLQSVEMLTHGAGYTSKPTLTLVGGTGVGAVLDSVLDNGVLATIKVVSPGSGYDSVGLQMQRKASTTELATNLAWTDETTDLLQVGQSVIGPNIPTNTVITALNLGTNTVTISNAHTGGASGDWVNCIFGVPYLTLTGGGATTQATAEVLMENGRTLYIPPGNYLSSISQGLIGSHNAYILAKGAVIISDGDGPGPAGTPGTSISNVFTTESYCRNVEVDGMTVQGISLDWSPRNPSQGFTFNGRNVVADNCVARETNEFGFTTAGQNITFNNCLAFQVSGDGFHPTSGSEDIVLNNCIADGCGDDCFGIINDVGVAGPRPTRITLNGCISRRGGFRGIAVAGADNVSINDHVIHNCMGYGIEVTDVVSQLTGGCTDVHIDGLHMYDQGTGGNGNAFSDRYGVLITDTVGGSLNGFTLNNVVTGTTVSPIYLKDATDFVIGMGSMSGNGGGDLPVFGSGNTNCSAHYMDGDLLMLMISDGTSSIIGPPKTLEAFGPSLTMAAGVLNTDQVMPNNLTTGMAFVTLTVGKWLVNGSITARSSTGAYYIIWAVFHDGTIEIGSGATAQEAPATRSILPVSAVIDVTSGTKVIGFKVKITATLGNTIDAGVGAGGPNSRIIAQRIG